MIRRVGRKVFLLCVWCFGFMLWSRFGADYVESESAGRDWIVYDSSVCRCSRQLESVSSISPESVDWCGPESTLRGNHQQVIAYSLFGKSSVRNETSKYFAYLETIARQVKHFYPGWRIRIYHNFVTRSHQHQLICRLYCNHDHVDLCDIKDTAASLMQMKNKLKRSVVASQQISNLNRLVRRYLPLLDPNVDRFMARDCDSEIIQREAEAVHQWLESNWTFHIIRDHQGHFEDILGGMFGVKVDQRRDLIQGLMRVMLSSGQDNNIEEDRSLDQTLLSRIFWPIFKDDAMIHDSYYCQFDWNSVPISPFPSQRVNESFVTDRIGSNWPRPQKCPPGCRPPDHPDWEYC